MENRAPNDPLAAHRAMLDLAVAQGKLCSYSNLRLTPGNPGMIEVDLVFMQPRKLEDLQAATSCDHFSITPLDHNPEG